MRTQTEQVAAEVAKERRELEHNPEVETEELAQVWIARGLPENLAREVAAAVHTNPDEALRVHAQEELGVDPDEQPSPWTAAISSFVCFSIGALIPLLPYLFGRDRALAGAGRRRVGLFLAGALVGPVHRAGPGGCSGLRQLALGAAAAGATYLIGTLIGGGALDLGFDACSSARAGRSTSPSTGRPRAGQLGRLVGEPLAELVDVRRWRRRPA